MRKKKEYRSAIRSRKLIREAFSKLMKEKSIDKITVTDIVNAADINRGTFYAHFKDTRSIIAQIENEIIDKMNQILSKFDFANILDHAWQMFLEIEKIIEQDYDIFVKLIDAPGSEQFLDKLRNTAINNLFLNKKLSEEVKKSKEFLLRVNYFGGGMVNLYLRWFKKEVDCSLRDISNELYKQIKLLKQLFLDEQQLGIKQEN
ncbi:MAG TPA: TetR/AcrR family transcriptional regulator [Bacilli bacterium]|nr:TetR/AcrR family transcriptional regulator [Bacilli bacterium]HQA19740.1 TetR/AcrR family transcriptional regulator [Bacilli bacterium]HQD92700.1 TetR/AcrR family transcriptional regulator [Bacilli bacterium]